MDMQVPDLDQKISDHFTYKEALWLPTWQRAGTIADGYSEQIDRNLQILFKKMDLIRVALNKPILVNCAWRPAEYNKLVGGASNSAHIQGQACDFHVEGVDCDTIRSILLPYLESYNLRMENKPQSNWVHVDFRPVPPGGNRYFIP
jgi:zinc D-Ala-D-Ala carboxypeptidase